MNRGLQRVTTPNGAEHPDAYGNEDYAPTPTGPMYDEFGNPQ
jgi:hypothetical protein